MGLAVGDAVGTTVEFQPRGTFAPVTDMVGGGPFYLQPGQWTDDTSMALCLATSLLAMGKFDAADQMNRYCDWHESGYLSSTGDCFDIGNTVRHALNQYRKTGNPFSGPTHPRSAGNGCLMRLAPVPMFYYPDREHAVYFSGESSRTTHGTQACIDASRLFGDMLFRALSGADKAHILIDRELEGMTTAAKKTGQAKSWFETLLPHKKGSRLFGNQESLQAIAAGQYQHKTAADIRGSGYVIHSLEAALWSFWATDTFEYAVLTATNLGDDADTTAAICGQLAGAFYGVQGIPSHWLDRLTLREDISTLADQLYAMT